MKELEEAIKKRSLVKRGDKVLLGVSGGPDSMALLLSFAALKKKMGLVLYVAHVDHNLRRDSAKDAAFVESWAKKLGIPFTCLKLSWRAGKKKGSLEEACRNARMDFFIRTALKLKAGKVALGHNLDDQAETVLMRLLRGTGLSGLSGIAFKRTIRGVAFIRPFLAVSRKRIEAFLKRRNISPRIDSTNLEDVFMRNRIRHRLIPLLKKEYNRNISGVLSSLAENASSDYDYLERAAAQAAKGGKLVFDTKKLMRMHPSILRMNMRQCIARLKGDTRRITFRHIMELEDLVTSRPPGSIVDLPQGVSARKNASSIRFYKR